MQWLLGIISELLRLMANKTDPEVLKQKRREKIKAEIEEAIIASRVKDAAKVNRILRSKWFRCVVIFAGCTAMQGCASTPTLMIVPKAEVHLPVVYDGIPGWFVPQPEYEKFLEAKIWYDNKEN